MERRTIDGVHFLRVSGTNVERARAHAMLLRDEVHDGPLFALAKKNEWLIRRGPGLLQHSRFLQDQVVRIYKKVFIPLLDRTTDRESREWTRAISEVTGIPYYICREAFFQPEALMFLSRISIFKHLMGELNQNALARGGLPGCSSAVMLRDWTASGRLLTSRNLDYPIVGPWEKHPTVIFHEPAASDEIPYVSMASAGNHTGGITSINREGLTLAAHAHFGSRVNINGRPMISIGDEIIRKAKTIGQAIDIARKYRRYAYWAFVVSSGKENDAVVLELGPDKTCVRHPEDGLLVHTNYFRSPELSAEEGLLSGGCYEDLYSRVCRMQQILEPLRGKVEPAHLTAVLGDHVDPFTGEERVFGNTLSVMTTVTSVVFDPEALRFWISSRNESPTGLGNFLEVDMEKFWDQDPEIAVENALPGYQPKHPRLLEGVHHYRNAYLAWHMLNDQDDYAETAIVHLRKAIQVFPSDGNLWVQLGIIAFFLKRFDEAFRCFKEAKERRLSVHVGHVCDLYLARCHDIRGEREEALRLYAVHDQVEEPRLRKALRKGLRRRYNSKNAGMAIIDLQFPDSFQY